MRLASLKFWSGDATYGGGGDKSPPCVNGLGKTLLNSVQFSTFISHNTSCLQILRFNLQKQNTTN